LVSKVPLYHCELKGWEKGGSEKGDKPDKGGDKAGDKGDKGGEASGEEVWGWQVFYGRDGNKIVLKAPTDMEMEEWCTAIRKQQLVIEETVNSIMF